MTWLELRSNDATYGAGWNFGESIWAPTLTTKGRPWPFWSLVGNVVKEDIIFHLRKINGKKYFVGYSFAATDGYVTNDSPHNKSHVWSFSQQFYKVDLKNFTELNPRIPLNDYFLNNDKNLRSYFTSNKTSVERKNIFYVIQSNRLQCLNGAYFSKFDNVLSSYLMDNLREVRQELMVTTKTDTVLKEILQRIGHQEFSDNVKKNFQYKCCFPNCEIEGKGFIISGHIARWADNESLRGNTDNGLCLCLLHDKAFELGYFTLDSENKVCILDHKINSSWLKRTLDIGRNLEIKARQINPSLEALKLHWLRIGYETAANRR